MEHTHNTLQACTHHNFRGPKRAMISCAADNVNVRIHILRLLYLIIVVQHALAKGLTNLCDASKWTCGPHGDCGS